MGFKPKSHKYYSELSFMQAYDQWKKELPEFNNYYYSKILRMKEKELPEEFEMFNHMKYAKLYKASNEESSNPFPDGFNLVLYNVLYVMCQQYKPDDEKFDKYLKLEGIYEDILARITKKTKKKLVSDYNIPKKIAYYLALMVPDHELITEKNIISIAKIFLNKIYDMQYYTADPEFDKKADGKEERNWYNELAKFNFANYDIMNKLLKLEFGKVDEKWINLIAWFFTYDKQVLDKKLHGDISELDRMRELNSVIKEVFLNKISKKFSKKDVENLVSKYNYLSNARSNHNPDYKNLYEITNIEYEECPKLKSVVSLGMYSWDDIKKDKKKKDKKKDKKSTYETNKKEDMSDIKDLI